MAGLPKGTSGNLSGRSKASHQAHNKLTRCINNSLDRITSGRKVGIDALSDRIARAIEDDVMGSLAVLSRYMPKVDAGGSGSIQVIINRDDVVVNLSDKPAIEGETD